MAKASIYTNLMDTKTISVKECTLNGELPYHMNFNKVLSSPSLFDTISLLIENSIKMKDIKYDKICATSAGAIPYATNIATSFEKGMLYINHINNDSNDKDNIKNIKIEGCMQIDDKILLIETVINNDFLINNIIKKIRKYGGEIMGLILIVNLCEGEYVELTKQKEIIIPILNIYDIFNHLENNNLIDLYYCEKVKFYCENMTKANINKLLSPPKEDISEVKEENKKEIFVSQ